MSRKLKRPRLGRIVNVRCPACGAEMFVGRCFVANRYERFGGHAEDRLVCFETMLDENGEPWDLAHTAPLTEYLRLKLAAGYVPTRRRLEVSA